MEKVNYVIQVNAAFESFNSDARIKQGHITLYFAFFQKWNREFFKKTITVNRNLIMKMAKIKSKTTYHNYLRDLNDWGYLNYFPSYDPRRGSIIKMTIFCSQPVQNLDSIVQEPDQNLVSSYKQINENFNKLVRPKNELEVLEFFKENNWPKLEGKKLYAFYQSRNWKLSRGLKIKNWKESARNYVEKGFKIKEQYTSPFSGYVDNLKNNNNKDYDMPL